jgi:hypothetical protein
LFPIRKIFGNIWEHGILPAFPDQETEQENTGKYTEYPYGSGIQRSKKKKTFQK